MTELREVPEPLSERERLIIAVAVRVVVEFVRPTEGNLEIARALNKLVSREPDVSAANSLPVNLTPRENQVMQLVLGGRTNKEVAAALGLSLRTVEVYRASVMRKLGIRSAAELWPAAKRFGLVV